MTKREIPLIKEYRIDRLRKCIGCIDRNAFSRAKQIACILNLYPNKKNKSLEHREKSIFRGMVIPSLRYLGLILGYGNLIRVSANGKIIIESQSIDYELHRRILSAVIYELDIHIFNFIDILKSRSFSVKKEFINEVCKKIDAPSEKQKEERILHWLSLLKQAELINLISEKIFVNGEKISKTALDLDANIKSSKYFKDYFFPAYRELSQQSAGVVDIADLREKVSLKMLREQNAVLTEKQFDELLRKIPFITEEYVISLGKPMGAIEKLFKYKDGYFKTLSIKFLING